MTNHIRQKRCIGCCALICLSIYLHILIIYKWTSCLKLPEGTYTYVNDAWGSHSWLDHLISTEGTYTYVSDAWGSHSWLDRLISTKGTYTYVSDAWGSHSWLDHLISTKETYTYVSDAWGSHSWSDHLISTEGTYTYVSDAWGSHSWLDHLISTEDGNNVITNMCVLYGTVQSDHIPVAVNIDLQLATDIDHGAVNNIGNKIDWSALSEGVIY